MRRVTENSLKEIAEYLELDYVPVGARVEDWGGFTDEGYNQVETLLVEWSNGIQIYTRECNQNLDVLINLIDYEKSTKEKMMIEDEEITYNGKQIERAIRGWIQNGNREPLVTVNGIPYFLEGNFAFGIEKGKLVGYPIEGCRTSQEIIQRIKKNNVL